MKQINLTKRMLAILMSIIMVLGMTPIAVITVFAAGSVSYVERSWDAEAKAVKEEVKEIPGTAEILTATTTELGAGYYTVPGDLTLTTLSITGDAHLILTDGTTLTVSDHITIKSGSLSIYGQSEETGSLIVEQGIRLEGGALTVHGGVIKATGYEHTFSGIDWAGASSIQTFTVYGGNLKAFGGVTDWYDGSSSGIGGGPYSKTLIYGGTVLAVGGSTFRGSGIGNDSDDGSGGILEIYGGEVDAYGGSYSSCGIGGFGADEMSALDRVRIYGGEVYAEGSDSANNPIESTRKENSACYGIYASSEVLIAGGNVETYGHSWSAGISSDNCVKITGGFVDATATGTGSGIGSSKTTSDIGKSYCEIYIKGGTVVAWGGTTAADIGGGYYNTVKLVCIDGGNINLRRNGIGNGYDCPYNDFVVKNTAGEEVSLAAISIEYMSYGTPITSMSGIGDYGLKDVITQYPNMLYFWLPSHLAPTGTVNGTEYACVDGTVEGVYNLHPAHVDDDNNQFCDVCERVLMPLFKIEDNVLYVSYDNGESYEQIGNVADGNGITEIKKTATNGNVDTYTIYYSDGSATTFTVTNGTNGADGKDGVTPQFKVENSVLYVSYDEGTSWTSLGSVKGDKGDTGNGIASIEKTKTEGNVDTYTITYTDGTTTTFTVTNGKDGINGTDGEDGHSPVITIQNGYWYIDGVNTNIRAEGLKGDTGNGISAIEKTGTEGLVDTYTITFTDGSTTTFTVTNGADGTDGAAGVGIEKVEKTSSEGNVDTYTITLTNGNTFTFTVTNGSSGSDGTNGKDGITPQLRINESTNMWEVSYDNGATWESLGISAVGSDGTHGSDGRDGADGKDGQDGVNGKDGVTPQLRINAETNEWEVSYDNGNTWTSLVVKATGENGKDGKDGKDGLTPFIGENGNWWIGDTDTGVQAAYDVSVPAGSGSVVENDGMNTATLIAIIIACLSLASNIVLVTLYVNQKKKIRL